MAVFVPALFGVARILVVPVGEQHHQDLETAQLGRADERVIRPRPVHRLQELRILGAELKTGVLEMSFAVDILARALQIARRLR